MTSEASTSIEIKEISVHQIQGNILGRMSFHNVLNGESYTDGLLTF